MNTAYAVAGVFIFARPPPQVNEKAQVKRLIHVLPEPLRQSNAGFNPGQRKPTGPAGAVFVASQEQSNTSVKTPLNNRAGEWWPANGFRFGSFSGSSGVDLGLLHQVLPLAGQALLVRQELWQAGLVLPRTRPPVA
jgi:hypothetical protein